MIVQMHRSWVWKAINVPSGDTIGLASSASIVVSFSQVPAVDPDAVEVGALAVTLRPDEDEVIGISDRKTDV